MHPYTLILLQRDDRLRREAEAARRGTARHPRWPRRRLPQVLRTARAR